MKRKPHFRILLYQISKITTTQLINSTHHANFVKKKNKQTNNTQDISDSTFGCTKKEDAKRSCALKLYSASLKKRIDCQ